MQDIASGTRVTCDYRYSYTATGKVFWYGTVASLDDPKAWTEEEDYPALYEHRQDAIGYPKNVHGLLPVRWDNGHTYFEDVSSLRIVKNEEGD